VKGFNGIAIWPAHRRDLLIAIASAVSLVD